MFDLLHVGHIHAFKLMVASCDYLIVGLNSDKSAAKLNKDLVKRPIIPAKERREMLLSLKYINEVIIFNEDTPYELIKKIKPHILFKGVYYKDKPGHPIGKELVDRVVFIPQTKHSTTKLLKKILKNQLR